MYKKSLSPFPDDLKDSFFKAIFYGFFFHLKENNKVCKDKTEEILGKELFDKFQEKKEMLQLDHSFGKFLQKISRCQLNFIGEKTIS